MIWLRGGSDDLLVNEIGRYAGTLAVGVGGGSFLLDASADGAWEIDVREPRNQRAERRAVAWTLPAQLPTETMVKEYKGPKAFQRDAPRQAEQGWRVIGQTEHRPRQGCLRIIMMASSSRSSSRRSPGSSSPTNVSSRRHHRRNRLRSVGIRSELGDGREKLDTLASSSTLVAARYGPWGGKTSCGPPILMMQTS